MSFKNFRHIIAAIFCLFLTSCIEKVSVPDADVKTSGEETPSGNAGSTGFSATISSIYKEGTKTTLGTDDYICWQDGDKIRVNGVDFIVSNADKTSAQFEKVNPADNDPKLISSYYHAFYPSSIGLIANGGLFPLEYNYQEDSVSHKQILNNIPMYAKSVDKNLSFHCICGVLEISLKDTKVSYIKISSDLLMYGGFSVESKDNSEDYYATMAFSEPSTITLSMKTPVEIGATPKCFYIAIPPGDYSGKNLSITVNDGTRNLVMKTRQDADSEIIINANYIYPISFNGSGVDETFEIGSGGGVFPSDWIVNGNI